MSVRSIEHRNPTFGSWDPSVSCYRTFLLFVKDACTHNWIHGYKNRLLWFIPCDVNHSLSMGWKKKKTSPTFSTLLFIINIGASPSPFSSLTGNKWDLCCLKHILRVREHLVQNTRFHRRHFLHTLWNFYKHNMISAVRAEISLVNLVAGVLYIGKNISFVC